MKICHVAAGLALAAGNADAQTLAQAGKGHRLLIVSDAARSGELSAQIEALADWRSGAEDRDVIAILLEGSKVEGVSDSAAAVRARYDLPKGRFAVALIGKDGHVAFRADRPVAGGQLERVIDAMPMRRAGLR